MAKELPYFRFTCQEWQNGDISLEDYELQGFFINFLSFYWVRDCTVTLDLAEKKFSNARGLLERCLKLEIIKHNLLENLLEIDFLNEQWKILKGTNEKRAKAGKIGGLRKSSNAKARLKQKPSYKDKDKDKDKEKNRTKRFTPPTPQEITKYCIESGHSVDSQRFVDYYSSNGWKVGKNSMKDWKATVRTWSSKDKTQSTPQKQTHSSIMV